MADQRSVEILAFNFACRTFAYRRLAQGLSRALSAFSSFMREYLDSVIKADQCAQNVDDIGIAANTTEKLIKNIRAVFKCIRETGLKLTFKKCHLGVTQIEFLGRTITHESKISSPKSASPNAKSRFKNILALSTTTAITYRACKKNSLACRNFSKQTPKSVSQRNL